MNERSFVNGKTHDLFHAFFYGNVTDLGSTVDEVVESLQQREQLAPAGVFEKVILKGRTCPYDGGYELQFWGVRDSTPEEAAEAAAKQERVSLAERERKRKLFEQLRQEFAVTEEIS